MQDSSMQRQWQSSHIGGANAAYVDELYESYLTDPNSVPEDWRVYFEKLPSVDAAVESDVPHAAVREYFLKKNFQDKKLLIIDIGAHKGETIDIFTQNFNLYKIFYIFCNYIK